MSLLDLFPLNSSNEGELCPNSSLEHPMVFVERFWRWRDSLYLVAYRVLDGRTAATEAVESCFRRTCREPSKFESDGQFGSWLLRILLDEALQARRRRKWGHNRHYHQAFAKASAQRTGLRHWLDDFWCLETTI